jgi:hypothetical protein
MSAPEARKLRVDNWTVAVYNSGPTVFLYDDAHADEIRSAAPSLLTGYYAAPEKDLDKPLLSLGEKGVLVVFELYQDDPLLAEVSIGPPLGTEEMQGLPWSRPQGAYLALPSGQLCIESMDSLRVGPIPPSDPGGRLSVPAGDYLVSLQCLSHSYEQTEETLWPEYFLSLQAMGAGPRPENRPFFTYPHDWRPTSE